jgi:hypothetical protein
MTKVKYTKNIYRRKFSAIEETEKKDKTVVRKRVWEKDRPPFKSWLRQTNLGDLGEVSSSLLKKLRGTPSY